MYNYVLFALAVPRPTNDKQKRKANNNGHLILCIFPRFDLKQNDKIIYLVSLKSRASKCILMNSTTIPQLCISAIRIGFPVVHGGTNETSDQVATKIPKLEGIYYKI